MNEAMPVRLREVELREVALPLVRPFRTSFGEEREKRALLCRVLVGDLEGWGECVAAPEPRYSEEWLDGAWQSLERFVVPAVAAGGSIVEPEDIAIRTRGIRGHRMAKAALEAAVLDAWLRTRGVSLAEYLGGVRDSVPCGVSVGIASSVDDLLAQVAGYLDEGYLRVKLKIEPGWDAVIVGEVRRAFPEAMLSVDANAAYSPADAPVFDALDEFGLTMIEQPLDHEDLVEHARLQRRLATPICLDESIRSSRDALAAIELEACRVINIKPGRVGGLLEARRVHDIARERGVPVWIGGMLETGVGRASNVALAALPGVTLPGDTSASKRYFRDDITEPFFLGEHGSMAVPTTPGIGVAPLPERLQECTVRAAVVFRG